LIKTVGEREVVVERRLRSVSFLFFFLLFLFQSISHPPLTPKTQIEGKLQKYHGNAEKLQLIPAQARFANGVDFTLRLNVHSSRPEQMLSVNLTTTIKVFIVYPFLSFFPACEDGADEIPFVFFSLSPQPSLVKLKEVFVTKAHEYQGEHHQLQEQVEKMDDVVGEKGEECRRGESLMGKLEGQYQSEKEAMSRENQEFGSQIERLERELAMMKGDSAEGIAKHEQRLQVVKVEYETVKRKASEDKERYGQALLQVLEELISHKSHIETSLGGLRTVAEAERDAAVADLSN